jgi:thioredoxin 1
MPDLDEESFERFSAGEGLRIVMFGADQCQPSREQRTYFEDLFAKHPAAARLAVIDALMHDGPRRKLNVRRLPTTVIFRDGRVRQTLAGYQPRQRIEALLDCGAREPSLLAA